jgi:pyruvate-formate lyase-activating enzyme
METLNQIEKQLKDRSIKELEEVVDNFLNDIKKIEDKYQNGSSFFDLVDEKYTEALCILGRTGVRHHLLYMLKKRHLDGMIKNKSKDLLAKLDLLS